MRLSESSYVAAFGQKDFPTQYTAVDELILPPIHPVTGEHDRTGTVLLALDSASIPVVLQVATAAMLRAASSLRARPGGSQPKASIRRSSPELR